MADMRKDIPFTMEEIFDYIQFDYLQYSRNRRSFNIPCPICDRTGTGSHLNVNLDKKRWRCPKCGSYGNGVNFYRLIRTGEYEMSASEYTQEIRRIKSGMEGNTAFQERLEATQERKSKMKQIPSSPIAPDEVLHETFSQLLEFPGFALLPYHKENLLSRGLNEEAIERNGYRSFPPAIQIREYVSPVIAQAFVKYDWGADKEQIPRLKPLGNLSIMLGMTVADWLRKKKCRMEGVPGFFKFKNQWCFFIPANGIVIPTRNMNGQIVSLQVRKDEGAVRYLTVSSKELEMGVNEGISRAHWPLANMPLASESEEKPEIILTEGPLKADVALHLSSVRTPSLNSAFVAIQGVDNTVPLLKDCKKLSELGYVKITNALDMDRLVNVNVMRGSKKLRFALETAGFTVENLFWDLPYALNHVETLKELCVKTGTNIPPLSKNPFLSIALLTKALKKNGFHSKNTPEMDWNSESKGIDDFLKTVSTRAEET